jgi:hypothetical protein
MNYSNLILTGALSLGSGCSVHSDPMLSDGLLNGFNYTVKNFKDGLKEMKRAADGKSVDSYSGSLLQMANSMCIKAADTSGHGISYGYANPPGINAVNMHYDYIDCSKWFDEWKDDNPGFKDDDIVF